MNTVSRRSVIRAAAGVASITVATNPAAALAALSGTSTRSIEFHNVHTDEALRITYFRDGQYMPDALAWVNYVLRDHRTGEVTPIDPELLDTLYMVRRRVGSGYGFKLLSGYRSPKTNAMLRRHSGGVARNSLHMKGMAADVRLEDISPSSIRSAAQSLHQGGVGYYPSSGFVHIDVGPVRSWGG